jgi:hypothetical protein
VVLSLHLGATMPRFVDEAACFVMSQSQRIGRLFKFAHHARRECARRAARQGINLESVS